MDVDPPSGPSHDINDFLKTEIKEWHFHIYFRPGSPAEQHAAFQLRDALMKLVRAGAFIAVPLFRVNLEARGPHPVGSYEVWVPTETFAAAYGWLCLNRGNLSVLVHPITNEPRADHDARKAWLGEPWPLDLSALPVSEGEEGSHPKGQYQSLQLGYNSKNGPTLEERRIMGVNVAKKLAKEEQAAKPTW